MQLEAVLFDLFDTLLLIGNDAFYLPSLKKLHDSLTEHKIVISFHEFCHVYFEIRDSFYAESRVSLEEPHFTVRISQTLQRFGYDLDVSDPIVVEAAFSFAEEFMRYVHLDENAINVLQMLHGRYKLGIVSNSFLPETVYTLLDKFDLKKFFDVIVVSAEINRRKPSPEIFEKALKALNADASKAVFVGDMPSLDIEGPKNIGMKAILIERRPSEKEMKVRPDCVIKSLGELPSIVDNCRC